ncbi:MAG TPA: beta-galactosidase GalB [Chitinophagaceae bacterium]
MKALIKRYIGLGTGLLCLALTSAAQPRVVTGLNKDWKFFLGDTASAKNPGFSVAAWKSLDLPHDWSIEGAFSEQHPATHNGGSLPTGIGWYRKNFTVPAASRGKRVYINFDGVQSNSEVWINGHYLGKRPNGYTSFRYELTPYLEFGSEKNTLSVKVDNSAQPASRWYTGSGIYRKVWLLTTNPVAFDQWGVFVTTPKVSSASATVRVKSSILNAAKKAGSVSIRTTIYDASGKKVATKTAAGIALKDSLQISYNELIVRNPRLWSVKDPYLYRVTTQVLKGSTVLDEESTALGIRSFHFDATKGFFLNGAPLKILGVCNHHDLGALGAAFNTRAAERQLEILKAMGTNAIRTAHNPPAPELLDLCDRMGFLVMDEAFDMWRKRKNKQDYHQHFSEWSRRDLADMVRRDRNHPSVFMWSIGNEIREQFDSTGITITRELADIVRSEDSTRPVTSALTENFPEKNFIYQSGALDVLGFNYKLEAYGDLPTRFPGQKFLATETSSALATRGHYDMPSDSNRLWPPDSKSPFTGNTDLTVSAYDHVYAYWGSSHEDGWKAVKKYPHMAGIFVWAGFDFLGEPVPYPWPARSSYYGVVDLAGFPKDAYYMYQSEWTGKPMLHLFPHWNWEEGKLVDVWAYYNGADEVELFLNGRSLGSKKKRGDSLHVQWRVPFEPGTLMAVSRLKAKTVLTKEIKTAGQPARIELIADRKTIKADGEDLSFVTVRVLDAEGNLVLHAGNLVKFTIRGAGELAGVDNGLQTSMESFKAPQRKAYNGLCLAIIRSTGSSGQVVLQATSEGLKPATITITSK